MVEESEELELGAACVLLILGGSWSQVSCLDEQIQGKHDVLRRQHAAFLEQLRDA